MSAWARSLQLGTGSRASLASAFASTASSAQGRPCARKDGGRRVEVIADHDRTIGVIEWGRAGEQVKRGGGQPHPGGVNGVSHHC